MERWEAERLAFAAEHPGLGMLEKTLKQETKEIHE